jgi:hypothetical protein
MAINDATIVYSMTVAPSSLRAKRRSIPVNMRSPIIDDRAADMDRGRQRLPVVILPAPRLPVAALPGRANSEACSEAPDHALWGHWLGARCSKITVNLTSKF